MVENQRCEVTELLARIRSGDNQAEDRLVAIAYSELRSIAARMMRYERVSHTLQPTALVHEAYLKLGNLEQFALNADRPYFFVAMSKAMRRALVEHARTRMTAKRGGNWERMPLDDTLDWFEDRGMELTLLDKHLRQLASRSEHDALAIQLYFFGGWKWQDVSEFLEIPLSTLEKRMRAAYAWLRSRIAESSTIS